MIDPMIKNETFWDFENTIHELVNRSFKNESDSKIANVLKQVFVSLGKRQETLYNVLDSRIQEETDKAEDRNKDWNINVAFLQEDEKCPPGFFYIARQQTSLVFTQNQQNNLAGSEKELKLTANFSFFLNVRYEELDKLCGEKFIGLLSRQDGSTEAVSYSLKRHWRFVSAERNLFKIAEMYGITRPVIYSPYARRAVDVVLDTDQDGFYDLDLQEEQNGLSEIIHKGNLVWNIEAKRDKFSRGGEVEVDGALHRYEYTCELDRDDNSFLLPSDELTLIRQNLNVSARTLVFSSLNKPTDMSYTLFTFHNTPKFPSLYFANGFDAKNVKDRIRSKADIAFVLNAFEHGQTGKITKCQFDDFGKLKKDVVAIRRYSREDAYHVNSEQLFFNDVKLRPACYIGFNGDKLFLTDFANYVLNYLQAMYPEFTWLGVELS